MQKLIYSVGQYINLLVFSQQVGIKNAALNGS